jgi:hypothetical protein
MPKIHVMVDQNLNTRDTGSPTDVYRRSRNFALFVRQNPRQRVLSRCFTSDTSLRCWNVPDNPLPLFRRVRNRAAACGGAIGAGAGAVAGHVVGGMKRSDLKDLGELLDDGTSGLVVVAASDVEAKVEAAITRAKKRAKAQLQADTDALKKDIDHMRAA